MTAFHCYISAEGTDVIREWYDSAPEELQGEFVGLVEVLAITPRKYWRLPGFRTLKNQMCAGLCTLRLAVKEVHHRVFGFDGPADEQFTLLLSMKKDDDPDYSKSCPEAQSRKIQVTTYEHHSHEYSF